MSNTNNEAENMSNATMSKKEVLELAQRLLADDSPRLADMVHHVLTKRSAWKVAKNWNEGCWASTILSNARNYRALSED
jgi:hypothetical protein